jgi:hypothetical protein
MAAPFALKRSVAILRTSLGLLFLLMALPTGCSRDAHTLPLSAPYADETLGALTATWTNTGDQRAFSGGARLKEPEVRFRYRLDARNDCGDKMYLRLGDVTLVDSEGLSLGSDPTSIECTLSAGESEGVRTGEVWVPATVASNVQGLRAARVAVPLGTRQVARYRQWLLEGRPGETAQVEAQIAQLAAAPPCGAR